MSSSISIGTRRRFYARLQIPVQIEMTSRHEWFAIALGGRHSEARDGLAHVLSFSEWALCGSSQMRQRWGNKRRRIGEVLDSVVQHIIHTYTNLRITNTLSWQQRVQNFNENPDKNRRLFWSEIIIRILLHSYATYIYIKVYFVMRVLQTLRYDSSDGLALVESQTRLAFLTIHAQIEKYALNAIFERCIQDIPN